MKIGFIGFGNMAGAIAQGMTQYGGVNPKDVIASALDIKRLKERAEKLGIAYSSENREVAEKADLLFLAVKPHLVADVIAGFKEALKPTTVVISVAAGVSISDLESIFSQPVKLVRTLPNTPAMVGEGMTLYQVNQEVTEKEEQVVCELLNGFGQALAVDEKQFAGAGSMTGCSPAFIYMLLEAMADAAVLTGMKRKDAYLLAGQTVKGSAQMLLETGLHPGELKDMVTSPGGTTIEGVRTLERLGFRSAMMEAIIAAAEKTGK